MVVYLLVYAVDEPRCVRRRHRRVAARPAAARSRRFGGLFSYAPGLAVLMTIFLASLAGIPPLGGWFAKFSAFKAVLDAGNDWGYMIARHRRGQHRDRRRLLRCG